MTALPILKDATGDTTESPSRQEIVEEPEVSPPLASPAPKELPPGGRELVDSARYADIAHRLLMGQKGVEIAADLGMSDRHLRRILHRPDFREHYMKVHSEFYSDLSEVIRNEKLQPLVRAQAQAIRAQTLVTEVMEEVQSRITSGMAKATDLKVGVDAAFGIMDRSKGDLSATPSAVAGVQVNFNVSDGNKRVLAETIEESGIDLSDIIDVVPSEETNPDDARTE